MQLGPVLYKPDHCFHPCSYTNTLQEQLLQSFCSSSSPCSFRYSRKPWKLRNTYIKSTDYFKKFYLNKQFKDDVVPQKITPSSKSAKLNWIILSSVLFFLTTKMPTYFKTDFWTFGELFTACLNHDTAQSEVKASWTNK